MRRMLRSGLALVLFGVGISLAVPAMASGEDAEAGHQALHWSFDGFFGTYDRGALKRGAQIYKEVCAACHSMGQLYYRNLLNIGLSEDEVKAIAASVQVADGPNDAGEMFERPGKLSDHFKAPFPNEEAARAANNGALPPDLSLITKARHGGADYVYSILTGYAETPAGFQLAEGMNYNKAFERGAFQIAMPQPLADNAVTYADGTPATLDQEARDVAQFLTWAAEPELEARKKTGIRAVLFLVILTLLFYAAKRKVWARVH